VQAHAGLLLQITDDAAPSGKELVPVEGFTLFV